MTPVSCVSTSAPESASWLATPKIEPTSRPAPETTS